MIAVVLRRRYMRNVVIRIETGKSPGVRRISGLYLIFLFNGWSGLVSRRTLTPPSGNVNTVMTICLIDL